MESNPAESINKLTEAINRGDLDAMTGYFEREAVLVVQALGSQEGQVVRGIENIREAYAGFVSMKPALRREVQHVIEAGNVALHFSRWRLSAVSPDGTKLERTAVSCDVLRKQPDGRWLVLVYNPYGSDVLGR